MTGRAKRSCNLREIVLAAGLALGLGAAAGHAQQGEARPSSAVRAAAGDFSGRDFAGVRLPAASAPQAADVRLSAARAWFWEEDAARGTFGATQRLLLRGDVTVELGQYRFSAAQAVVWIEQLPDRADAGAEVGDRSGDGSGSPPRVRTRQIAVFFDRVSDPTASAAFSQAGDRLLVTGVLRGEVSLKYDVMERERPTPPERIATFGRRPLRGEGYETAVTEGAAFVAEAERRLARHLRRLTGIDDTEPAAGEIEPPDADAISDRAARGAAGPTRPIRPGVSRPYEPGSPIADAADTLSRFGSPSPSPLPPVERLQPIFAAGGIITAAVNTDRMLGPDPGAGAGDPDAAPIRFLKDEQSGERIVMLSGGVVVQYTSTRNKPGLEITATRAVIFLREAAGSGNDLGSLRFDAESVRGLYLEGDVVAISGDYTLRGPRVYYDLENDQAVMPDAVFQTYDARRGLPLVVRAKTIRQLADRQWSAEGARLATTSFADPVFSIGASSVTITQTQAAAGDAPRTARGEIGVEPSSIGEGAGAGGPLAARGGGEFSVSGSGADRAEDATYVDARNITLRAGSVPFFWLPRFSGDVQNIPLRDVRIENSSGSGAAFKTTWDLFSSTGLERPPGMRSNLLLDWYFDRGPGIGTQTQWDRGNSESNLLAYTVPNDWGRDVLSSGLKRGRDEGEEFRGLLLADHNWNIDQNWSLQLETGIVSDENFVDAFFKPLAYQGREVTNAAYLKYQDDQSLFSGLVKGAVNDFTVNQYLLQSQGYTVDKLPEFSYFRAADDLLEQTAPGMLIWSSEYRLSRMALRFTKPTADELGFDTAARARAALGYDDPNLSPEDFLWNAGYREGDVLRADTRQELSSVFAWGPVKFNPFVTGRFTGYDDRGKFEEFAPGNPEDEDYRYWYATGMRMSTEIVRIDDSVESSLFDLHRTRHIIEPNVTIWYAGSNLSQNDLPVYDDQVESLATGAAVRAGIDQTWQTKRGGPGRWRDVDVLKINAAIVEASGDADTETPLGRFFDYRPEYSNLGDHATLAAAWQATDVVALTFDSIYDLENNQPARTSAGGLIQHSPDFASYAEVRYLNALDVTYVNFGVDYKLTRRYFAGVNATYDTDEESFQSVNFTVRRKVPEAALGVGVGYNDITDETTFRFIFEPNAAPTQNPNERLRDIGR